MHEQTADNDNQWDPDGATNRPKLLAWIDRVKEEREAVLRVVDASVNVDDVEASDVNPENAQ